jgi:hypothetical protein
MPRSGNAAQHRGICRQSRGSNEPSILRKASLIFDGCSRPRFLLDLHHNMAIYSVAVIADFYRATTIAHKAEHKRAQDYYPVLR